MPLDGAKALIVVNPPNAKSDSATQPATQPSAGISLNQTDELVGFVRGFAGGSGRSRSTIPVVQIKRYQVNALLSSAGTSAPDPSMSARVALLTAPPVWPSRRTAMP